ncbi:hypothetical protein [Paenarthrobacter sp. NPDC090522]|uniref:hypothetical protein n=1 Tax=Paenarthrobacter sp. NPDC090522 TaxID=3364383 RepID=UPI003818854F
MTSETTTNHPTRAGEVVQDSRGRLGIVTDPARKAGVYKGKIGVMWAFGPYEVAEWPEELSVVDPAAVRSFAANPAGRDQGTTPAAPYTPATGDRVRVGKGKAVWTFERFTTLPSGAKVAALSRTNGYTNTTVEPERLTPAPQEETK